MNTLETSEALSLEAVPERPDLLALGKGRLSLVERLQIAMIRRSFEPGLLDAAIRLLQRTFGSTWIHHCTKHLRYVHGLERVPSFPANGSFVCVANHRSFFDLYVVTAELVRRGLQQRIVFPVRAKFFYDHPLGFFVNGIMSFFAMYPPIFRNRRQLKLNPASLDELAWLLRRGGVFAGMHPEGTRNLTDNPYELLPAQRGVGHIIHAAKVPVIPVFINGLINDLPRQVGSNFDRSGIPIHVVFGKPIQFGDLFDKPASPKVHQAVADLCVDALSVLGQEERALRAAHASALGRTNLASKQAE